MISQFEHGKVIKSKCLYSVKECSRDKSECMVDIDTQVVNFDMLKREFCNTYLKSSEETMKSVDCYLELDSGDVYLIEFKNGKIARNQILGLKLKLKDSLLLINESFDKNLKFCKNKIIYIVVYNRDKNPSENKVFKDKLTSKSELKHIVRFNLDPFRGILKDVKTLDVYEFKDFWENNIQSHLRNNTKYMY